MCITSFDIVDGNGIGKKTLFFLIKNCKLKQHERERHIMPCIRVVVGGFDDLYMDDVDKL